MIEVLASRLRPGMIVARVGLGFWRVVSARAVPSSIDEGPRVVLELVDLDELPRVDGSAIRTHQRKAWPGEGFTVCELAEIAHWFIAPHLDAIRASVASA